MAVTAFCHISKLLCSSRDPSTLVALDDGCARTFADFRAAVSRLASLLCSRPGRRYALHCENAYAFATGLLALLHADKQILLPPHLQPHQREVLPHQVDGLISDQGSATSDAFITAPLGADMPETGFEFAPLSTTQPVLELCTSGTTGESKRIPKTLRNLEEEVRGLEEQWGELIGPATVYGSVSVQHIYGLLFRVLWPLAAGRPFSAVQLVYPEELLTQSPHPFCLITSPAQLKRMPDLVDVQLLSAFCRAVFSSGGLLPEESALRMQRGLGRAPLEVFGSTETGGIAWRTHDEPSPVWHVFQSVNVACQSDGRLRVQSPYVCTSLPDDWFVMGDSAEILSPRTFLLGERTDRIVKVEEKRVSLIEIERRLTEHPLVAEAAALLFSPNFCARQGWPQRQRLGAAIVLRDAGRLAEICEGPAVVSRLLREHLLRFFEKSTVPRSVRFVRRLPAAAHGKCSTIDLEALFEAPHALREAAGRAYPMADLEQCGGDYALVKLEIPPELIYFDGHYPNAPLVPGFVQVHWAASIARALFNCPHHVHAIEALKFQTPLLPNARCELHLTWKEPAGRLEFRIAADGRTYSSGRMLTRPGEGAVI